MTKKTKLSTAAVNALVKSFTPFAVKAAKRQYGKRHTKQEKGAMYRAALKGLHQAAAQFNPARSGEFQSCVEKCVGRSLERCYRKLGCRSQFPSVPVWLESTMTPWDNFPDDTAA